jgi:hypothetical protein
MTSAHPFRSQRLPLYARIGWTGTRLNLPPIQAAARHLVARIHPNVEHLTCSAPADQAGFDFYIRQLVDERPHRNFASPDRHAYNLVGRSVQMVERLGEETTLCLLVGFPGKPCPPRVSPSARATECFNGSGSGSWATLAYAAGQGIDLLVWLDPGATLDARPIPPPWWGAWDDLGAGWWYRPRTVVS